MGCRKKKIEGSGMSIIWSIVTVIAVAVGAFGVGVRYETEEQLELAEQIINITKECIVDNQRHKRDLERLRTTGQNLLRELEAQNIDIR